MTDKRVPSLLLLTERYAPDVGGVARSAKRIATSLTELGLNVDVLAWTKSLQPGQLQTHSDSEAGDAANGGCTVHRLGLFANWDSSFQHTFNVLEWLHDRNRYDAVWGHYVYPAGFAAVMFGESLGLPSTVSARGNDIDRLMFPPGDFSRLLWTLQRASVVSTVSDDLAKKIDMLLGYDRESIKLPNVVDLNTFAPISPNESQQLRAKHGLSSGELVLGFCGELRHKKGLPFLLNCLRDLNQGRQARLLVIGSVRPREQRQLKSFGLDYPALKERLTITGHQDDPEEIAQLLHVCDVLLFPSLWEGVPNALLEAMACGKLVIASNAGGIPEIVEHGSNGVLVPKDQLHRLGEAILETMALPVETRQAISTKARRFCEQLAERQVERAALNKVIQRLLSDYEPLSNSE